MPTSWIFVPASNDEVIGKLVDKLSITTALVGNDPLETGPGKKELGGINDATDPVLFIAGHGNFGQGIGTHRTHYGARRMVRLLMAEGLGKIHENLTIHLVACNSGVAMRRMHVFTHREPYVKRFAEALANQGFHGVTVIGYAGFVHFQLVVIRRTNLLTGKMGTDDYMRFSDDPAKVVYTVKDGKATKTSGGDWESRTGVGRKTFGLIHVEPKGSAAK